MPRENKLFNAAAVRYLADQFQARTTQLQALATDFEKKAPERYVSMAHYVSLEAGLVAVDEFLTDMQEKISAGKFVQVFTPPPGGGRGARTTEKPKPPHKGGGT